MPEAIILIVMSMLHRRSITLTTVDGKITTGVANMLQAEDGSGTSFNVALDNGMTCYFKRPIGLGTPKDPIRSQG